MPAWQYADSLGLSQHFDADARQCNRLKRDAEIGLCRIAPVECVSVVGVSTMIEAPGCPPKRASAHARRWLRRGLAQSPAETALPPAPAAGRQWPRSGQGRRASVHLGMEQPGPLGRPQLSRHLFEEREADIQFEIRQHAADGRLGNAEMARRLRDTAGGHDRVKGFELSEGQRHGFINIHIT